MATASSWAERPPLSLAGHTLPFTCIPAAGWTSGSVPRSKVTVVTVEAGHRSEVQDDELRSDHPDVSTETDNEGIFSRSQ